LHLSKRYARPPDEVSSPGLSKDVAAWRPLGPDTQGHRSLRESVLAPQQHADR
jgi:hypothetical protein